MDRNNLFSNPGSTTLTSLSARRAWIEMLIFVTMSACRVAVALRKESVDRNVLLLVGHTAIAGRSPQGERG